MITLVHPGCNANVRAVAEVFSQANLLDELFTSISSYSGLMRFRQYSGVPHSKINTYPFREYTRLLFQKLSCNHYTRHETGLFSVDQVWREIDERASHLISLNSRLVYAYEDAALNIFREATRRGLKKIYDLPIGYWKASKKIYEEEIDLFPEFSSLIEGLKDSSEKLQRKDSELALADRVHASSSFVKKTLLDHGYPENKILVTTFGTPSILAPDQRSYFSNNILKVLFVGRVDQRKGIGYLLKSMEHFDPHKVEFHIVGSKPHSSDVLKPYWNRVIDHGVLSQNRVWSLMQQCDVFVLPTLFEGQALVALEAMANGMPVITTPNSGMEGILEDSQSGFLIPIRSTDKIVEKIQFFLDHPEVVSQMGKSAFQKARQLSWKNYQNQVIQSAQELLSQI